MRKKTSDKGQKGLVLIASSDAALRQRCVLGLQDAFPVHQISSRVELEHTMTQSKPAVLLLDLDLPQIGDIEGVAAIQHLCPSTNIILFRGAHNEKEEILALKSGAKGYCGKEIDPSLLRKAVNVVQKGEVWAGRKTISHLLAELNSFTETGQKDCPPLTEVYLQYLTPRERQIALLVGEGACNKEIASRLDISERTVKAHLTAIFRKLQISDRLRLGLFIAGQNNADHS
jgi:DNA-binding NarL/FixJ family response regulator